MQAPKIWKLPSSLVGSGAFWSGGKGVSRPSTAVGSP
uniref:Uncharacterized protein n=1 Tax=Zea mays TaxID=4577 RepID=C0P9C5_MAIZE|nr:unknown [Zea mays]